MQFDQALLPAQYDFVMDTTSKYLGFSGGYGSGKSQAAQIRTLKLMMEDPNADILYGMPSYDLLQIRIVPEFESLLKQYGINYSYTKQSKTFDLDGFGKIYLRSFDAPSSYVAFEVAHCILDELDVLPFEKADDIFKKALSRIRQRTVTGQPNSLCVVSTPDQGLHGAFYHRFVDKPAEGTRLIKSSTKANFFNPPDYVKTLYDTYSDESLVCMYLEGEFVSLNKVKQFSRYEIIANNTDRTIQPEDHLWIGLDFNHGACVYVIGVKDDDTLHLVGEGHVVDTMAFIERFEDYPNPFTVTPDATGRNMSSNADKSSITLLRDAGFRLRVDNSNPRVAASLMQCNNHLFTKKLLINKDLAPQLSKAMDVIGFDQNGKPEKFNTHPAYDDYVDSMRYLVNKKMPLLAKAKVARMRF